MVFNFPKHILIKDTKGKVHARVSNDSREIKIPVCGMETFDFRPLDGNPNIEHLELIAVETLYSGKRSKMNAGFAILPNNLPRLRFLEIRGGVKNPEVLTNYKELQHLNTGTSFFPTDLEFLRALPNLESMEINANQVEDLSPLVDLPMLRELVLNFGFKFDLRPLARCRNLRRLEIYGHVKGAKYLKELPDLEVLALVDFKLKDFDCIKHMTKLRWLSLAGSKMTDFEDIQNFRDLQQLNLGQTKIDNHNLCYLSGLPKLRELSLMYVNTITDIIPLGTLPAIEDLNLYEMRGPIKSLAPLLNSKRLKTLNIMNTPFLENPTRVLCEMTFLTILEASFQTTDEQEKVRIALNRCKTHFTTLPDPTTYKNIGFVRVWLPTKKGEDYYISQDITDELGVKEQEEAEQKVKAKLKSQNPLLLKYLDFDSEGSAFVVSSKKEEAILAVAELITKMTFLRRNE